MDWLIKLFTTDDSVAHVVLLYSLVISLGVYLGKIKIGGISLGVTFILFVGILAGHVGFTGPTGTLNFLQDFGLILFVFMIGLQVGPGFFESFGKGGLKLNMLACLAILLNIVVMFACYYVFFDTADHKNLPMMVGTMYGAVTNTPGLGAAKEALHSVFPDGMNFDIASGYACAYPLGVIGIIGATLAIRFICKVDIDKENAILTEAEAENPNAKPHIMYLRIENSYIGGRTLQEITDFLNRDVVCTRLMHDGVVSLPSKDTVLHLNDEVLIVCAEADAEAVSAFIGPQIEVDWHEEDQPQQRVAELMGNSEKRLNAPNIATIFVGIVVGILFGSLPFAVPGMPVPLKLGLAGGPLIIAILLGRFGHRMRLVTYTTTSANMMLREIGLALFLASVGIKAGAGFWDTVVQGDGLKYVYTGFLITIIPILIVGTLARMKYKLNYFIIMGAISGAYTDPPALAYANSVCAVEAPALGYSTVYPLSMFLRILAAQLIILFCCGA